MFFFKKCIGFLLSPGTVVLILLGIGMGRLTFSTRSKRPGWIWICLGISCFYLFSTAPLPSLIQHPLEATYKPFEQVDVNHNIKYIVVLSGDLRKNSLVPPTSRLGATTAARVVEGIRLFRLFQDQPTIIMSGGGKLPVGDTMAAFARSLGIPAEKIIAESKSPDTHGNAQEVKAIIQDAPFLLVTSASHLPRAMLIFQGLGLRPIPAPADFNVPDSYAFSDFLPSGGYLTKMDAAIHEYLGLAYLKLFPHRSGK